MSRIGKKPVAVPSGVKVSINNRVVRVESGSGSLEMTHRPEVDVAWDEAGREVVVTIPENKMTDRASRALWGTTRALIQNMVEGVTKGYQKQLEVVGVGWSAINKGKALELKLGFANIVEAPIPQGLDVSVERNIITIKGPDKQAVGQFAAAVRAKRKPEPYNGKGIKYSDEVVRRKSGKVFGS